MTTMATEQHKEMASPKLCTRQTRSSIIKKEQLPLLLALSDRSGITHCTALTSFTGTTWDTCLMRLTGRKMSRAQFSTQAKWQAKTLCIILRVARSCKIQAHWWSQWIRRSLMPMLTMWMNLSWMTDLCSSWCHNCKRLNSLIRQEVASPWGFRAKCVTR